MVQGSPTSFGIGLKHNMLNQSGELVKDQFVALDQFLTPRGLTTLRKKENPFIAGNAIDESEEFVGKPEILRDIEVLAASNGVVAIEGGHRSGKTSLLEVASARLVSVGIAKKRSDIVSFSGSREVNEFERLRQEITDGKGKVIDLDKQKSVVIPFDEIENLGFGGGLPRIKRFVEVIRRLKESGHLVLLSVIGDLRSKRDSAEELSLKAKEGLLSVVGNAIVVNRLLNDDEVRQVVGGGEKPLFTPEILEYLVKEAGGHPFLANLLAQQLFSILSVVKMRALDVSKALPDFQENVGGTLRNSDIFNTPTECVLASGFDPQTWDYAGVTEDRPNETVYKNMLPRESSTFFQNWLEEFMRKKMINLTHG